MTGQDGDREHLAGTDHAESGACHRDRAGVEVADQPRARARRAGHRGRDVDDQRRTAQPRHRPDDRGGSDARCHRRRRPQRPDDQRSNRPVRRCQGRLRPGGHGAAVRSAGRGAGLRNGRVRRRRAGPGPSDRTAAGRHARARCAHRRRRVAVLRARGRSSGRRHRRDRRVGVVTVRVRAAAVGCGVHRRADHRAHRRGGAVGAARRDDGGDAARRRRRRRRLTGQPVAGLSRPDRGAALGDRAGPVERGAIPRRCRRQRGNRAGDRVGRKSAPSPQTPSLPSSRSWVRLCGTAVHTSKCRAPSSTAAWTSTCTMSAS